MTQQNDECQKAFEKTALKLGLFHNTHREPDFSRFEDERKLWQLAWNHNKALRELCIKLIKYNPCKHNFFTPEIKELMQEIESALLTTEHGEK